MYNYVTIVTFIDNRLHNSIYLLEDSYLERKIYTPICVYIRYLREILCNYI